MRRALHVPNFAEPPELLRLGITAEASGWDGVFLWDHLLGTPGFPAAMADPWVVLGALASRTERVRLGTMVTPLARRRPQKVAREAVTLDHLSGGRAVLGVGLGNPLEEYRAFGDEASPTELAARLDEALDVVTGLWRGEPFDHRGEHFTVEGAQFLPTPLQRPRIPVWVACMLPHRRPLRRAARWDGVVLGRTAPGGSDLEVPGADEVRAVRDEILLLRGGVDDFDLAVIVPGRPAGDVATAYEELGVTWVLVTGWMPELHELSRSGPG